MQFPALYQQGPKNIFFDWCRIFGWMANGLYSSLIIFFLTINIVNVQPFRAGGQTIDMNLVGTIMFTTVIWTVNVQIAMKMSHFTWIQHLFVWGSIATWYIFLLGYGFSYSLFSDSECQIIVEALALAPIYWLSTLFITTVCNLPYLTQISYQRTFHPMDHHVV
ncbi:Phospholipid-transporting ATPase 6 [Dendrobium catenatum]|uniref:Phospholipid-transporting ATPase 6 n=1 Tax=Dendrobium catenatum TaxID=906689 RepID=A0A2I0W223_9ASPA|nr:Phospholipid-transporting ATPase 6 [Dendrobium catenatum]